jgi:hypothetical protein
VNTPAEPTVVVVVDAPPGTPARVMNPGTQLSREVAQELAAVVERTFRRERLRRRSTVVTISGAALLYALLLWAGEAPLTHIGQATLTGLVFGLPGPLTLHLLWGARNRALLDVAAAEGAVSRAVLVDAVHRMRRERVGPSTALRDAQAAETRQ